MEKWDYKLAEEEKEEKIGRSGNIISGIGGERRKRERS